MTATRPWHVISLLGMTQIFAWGSSYYLPAVLVDSIATSTGWPRLWVVGSLSLGLLVAGAVSPLVGRLIDRHGGRLVLATSALCLGLGQIGLAASGALALHVASWLVMGVGMGAGLYDAAFATLGRLYGHNARRAITSLTLFGGFASTLCWPLSAFLVSHLGWRGACLVYAAIQLGGALPAYLLLLPSPPIEAAGDNPVMTPVTGEMRPTLPLVTALAVTLTLASMISSVLSVHLLAILQAGGLTLAAAVTLGAMVGPSQVAARAIEMGISRHHHAFWTKVASVTFVAIGVGGLWAGFTWLPGVLAFYGAGIGLESIARGTLPLALFGASGYASLMGRLAMPSLIAQAAAPSIGALLLDRLGASATLASIAAVSVLNVVLVAGLGVAVAGIPRELNSRHRSK